MKNKNIFNDKRLKYGTYSTVITIVLIAILVVFNLIIGKFNRSFDFTDEDIFSLSEESIQVLDTVKEDINVYTLFSSAGDDAITGRVDQVLDQYMQHNSHIKTENRDLYLHPDFAEQYSSEGNTVDVNSIIVEANDRFRIIKYEDYFNSEGRFSLESCLTSAIQYVNMSTQPTIYYITGHGEAAYESYTTLDSQLRLANYDVKTVNLLESDIPDDCRMLLITPTARDYSEAEAKKVLSYLADDGRAYMILGGTDTADFKNLAGIASAYGIRLEPGYIYEGDDSRYMMYPYAVLPELKDHDINASLISNGYTVATVACQALGRTEITKQGLETIPLLTASDKAYIKTEGNTSANKEAGDKEGPFDIAVAVTDSTYTDKAHSTKLIITGASFYLAEPNTDAMVNNANSTFIVNGVNWLNDSEENIFIPAKSLQNGSIVIDAGTAGKIKLISWGIIPGILFAAGFIVWLIRRNK